MTPEEKQLLSKVAELGRRLDSLSLAVKSRYAPDAPPADVDEWLARQVKLRDDYEKALALRRAGKSVTFIMPSNLKIVLKG